MSEREQPTRYLFVCQENLMRSPWAARWFSSYCQNRGLDVEVDSAGIRADPRSSIGKQVTRELVERADWIICMEKYIAMRINRKYGQSYKKIVWLDTPDNFMPGLGNEDVPEATALESLTQLIKEQGSFGPKVFERILEQKVVPIISAA